MKHILILFSFCFVLVNIQATKRIFQLSSPSGDALISVMISEDIQYKVEYKGDTFIDYSPISMTLDDGTIWGENAKVNKFSIKTFNEIIKSPFYKKNEINASYKELLLELKGDFNLIFRAYNDGVAYRFEGKMKGRINVQNEQASVLLGGNYQVFAGNANKGISGDYFSQYFNTFESLYNHAPVQSLDSGFLKFLPIMVEHPSGKKMVITEVNLEDYPGMYFINSKSSPKLMSNFAPAPKDIKTGGGRLNSQIEILSRQPYIAQTNGTRNFPWRVFVLSEKDCDILSSDMVYALADPCRISDFSWVKPGKVAWDWWNDLNLKNVDFVAGVNNETYKYYIDFASKHNIPYVIMDEGWSVKLKADLMQVVPEINLSELIKYGKERNVGLIIWSSYWPFARDMEKTVKYYSELGIKGFKVDFMDSDDQTISQFIYKAAKVCAQNKIMLDFHGIHKPTGLQRTYPNVINYEGVLGLEYMKWVDNKHDQVTYDVTIPYIRQVAGPMDYTSGAMRNANARQFYANYEQPMSQGTRSHQIGMYVVFDAPLSMLSDNPNAYTDDEICTNFISRIPNTWIQTKGLAGEVGKYVVVARQSESGDWYIGALNNWDERQIKLDLSFIGKGSYEIEEFKDGINANHNAQDYIINKKPIEINDTLTIILKKGGGYVARIIKK